MQKTLADILLWFLAAYGVMSILWSLAGLPWQRLQKVHNRNSGIRQVLIIKNQEDTIEGIIRNMFSSAIREGAVPGEKLVVLDMGSSDETLPILSKLKESYENLEVLDMQEKDIIFRGFEN